MWGRENFCEGNEVRIENIIKTVAFVACSSFFSKQVAVGSCGSGSNDDCGPSIYHQLLCCDMPEYHYENCVQYNGDYGEPMTCKDKTHSDAEILCGACGSGGHRDCEGGVAHEVGSLF